MALLSRCPKVFAGLMVLAFAGSETVIALPLPVSKAPLQVETGSEPLVLVRRGRGKGGHGARGRNFRGKSKASARYFRRHKLRELRRHAARAKKSRRAAIARSISRIDAAAVAGTSVIFGSPMWNSTGVAAAPNRIMDLQPNPIDDIGATDAFQNDAEPLRAPALNARDGNIDCNHASTIVSGYGFSDLVPRSCAGSEYVFEGVRDTQLYVVKLSSADGELMQVSKLKHPATSP